MPMLALNRQWKADDLKDFPDDGNRYEVIDGELFVSPSPSLDHQDAVYRIHQMLASYVDQQGIGYVYSSPADVTFSAGRSIQPDVFIVPLANGRRPRAFIEVKRLLVAIEVLSPSTARADRVTKRALFRDEGVVEYWIIDLDARTLERSTLADSRPEILAEKLEWFPEGASAPFVMNLVDYFAQVLDS
jgi:Uma2 family endonuclease